MRALLISKDLWTVVDHPELVAEDKRELLSSKAASLMILYMEPSLALRHGSRKYADKAKELWSAVETESLEGCKARELQLRKQLTSLTMQPTENIQSYVDRAELLFAKLERVGAQIKEDSVCRQLLCNVTQPYKLTAKILVTGSEQLSLSSIAVKLAGDEPGAEEDKQGQALLSSGSGATRGRVCWKCGKKGHVRKDCPARGGDASAEYAEATFAL